MKKFLISLFCVTMFVACGEDDTKNDPPPPPEPISADAATGRYDLTGVLGSISCSEEEPTGEEVDLGEWIMALTVDEYLFLRPDGFLFSSTDGETFTQTIDMTFWCDSEVVTYTAVLTFDTNGLSGTITVDESYLGCWAGYDENDEPVYEDYECVSVWNVTGVRQ